MSDTLSLSAQHPPAIRVGGRRLSVSTRPRARTISGGSPQTSTNPADRTGSDYPRPTVPIPIPTQGDTAADALLPPAPPPPHNEEEIPKKEKKHTHGSRDNNRLREGAYHKLEATMPSKDHLASKHGFGAAGRIGQPMGKVLAV